MKLNVAGSTTMPVKIGMNSHTRLMKYDNRDPRGGGQQRARSAYIADEHRNVADQRSGNDAAPSMVIALTRGSRRCSRPGCAAMSSVNNA